MSDAHVNSELFDLLDLLWNEQISESQFSRLQTLLRDDPSSQQLYLDYLDLHLGLRNVMSTASCINFPTDSGEPSNARSRLRHRKLPRLAIGALLVIVAVIVIALLPQERGEVIAHDSLTIDELNGNVRIVAGDESGRDAASGMQVEFNDRVELSGTGTVVLAYDDGTRMTLVNNCAVTRSNSGQKNVMLHYGVLSAEVARQPTGQPMIVATPNANVEVIGTRFAVEATDELTELNVSEGRVRVTQAIHGDGDSVDVSEGQGLVAQGAELTLRSANGPPDTWEVDFEKGVPIGWQGEFVDKALPSNSRGAVRSVQEEGVDTGLFLIASRDAWLDGLFVAHDDTHLNVTCKMDQPDWINMFFITRSDDATNPTTRLYKFDALPTSADERGVWKTVTIPLSKFQRKTNGGFSNTRVEDGELAFGISWSAPFPDRGLVIDRVWVTRGGPEKVTFTEEE